MDVFAQKVHNTIQDSKVRFCAEETPFSVKEMINIYGKQTVQDIYDKLQSTTLSVCAKEHEEHELDYRRCPLFGSNLLCGHQMSTRNYLEGGSLETGGGIIATATYIVDSISKPISHVYIPSLLSLTQKLLELDGAAFVAYRKQKPLGSMQTNVPKNWRRKDLENLKTVEELRDAISQIEQGYSPEVLVLRNEVIQEMKNALGIL